VNVSFLHVGVLDQVLGLWMVVVDHQVGLVISHLSSDKKNQLRQLLFRYKSNSLCDQRLLFE
jgi:hypothetical protein